MAMHFKIILLQTLKTIDKHLLNVALLIDVTNVGILISINDEHSLNTSSPINVTDSGIVIFVNDEQKKFQFQIERMQIYQSR